MGLEEFLAECEGRYSPDCRMLGRPFKGPGYHSRVAEGTHVHDVLASLDYALALLRSGRPEYAARAADVVRAVLKLQDTDTSSPTYGIWPWLLEEPLASMSPPDWNWADFCGARLAQMLADHAASLPADLVQAMRAALGHAAWAIFRRNVSLSYTNIALMGAGVTLAAGEILQDPRLADYGRLRLRRLVEHTEYHGGFNEYNSPTYTMVALEECERIPQVVRDSSGREDAERLRRVAWQTIAEHYHPGTCQWAGPWSRGYSLWLSASAAGYLSEQTGATIVPHAPPSAEKRAHAGNVRALPCPPEFADRFRALPRDPVELKSRFIRRDADETSTWGYTWQTADACLGSVSRDDLWSQRHALLAYWRTPDDPAVALRLRFLHDGQDFASAVVQNIQAGPRVLSVVGMASDLGDRHHHLDRPPTGVFEAADFRVRYELVGRGAAGRSLGGGRFELAAGGRRAMIHTVPGRFGLSEVDWQCGNERDRAFVDGVCYSGPRREFDLGHLGEIIIAAGLELLGKDDPQSTLAPSVKRRDETTIRVGWPIGVGLRLVAPTRPAPYAR